MFPVPMEVPPQLPVNHSRVVPLPPLAVSIIFPGSSAQKLSLLLDADIGAIGNGLTVMTTVEIATVHGPTPSGSLVVRVRVTDPLVILGV